MVLDGHVSGTQSLNATLALPALTTTGLSETVYVYAAMTGTGHSIVSITDSLNELTFSRRMLVNNANPLGPSLDVWAAQTTSALSADVITINVSSAAFVWSAGAVAWKDGNQSTPYDTNGPWGINPSPGGGLPTITGISTGNGNNVLFAFVANNVANTQVAGTSFIIIDTPSQAGGSSADQYYNTTGILTNFTASFGDVVPDTSAWTMVVDAMQKAGGTTDTPVSGSVGIASAGVPLVSSQIVSGEVGLAAEASTNPHGLIGIGVSGSVSISNQNVFGNVGIGISGGNSGAVGIGVSGSVLVEQSTTGSTGIGVSGVASNVPLLLGTAGIGVSGTASIGQAPLGTIGLAVGQGGSITIPSALIGTSVIGSTLGTQVIPAVPLVIPSQVVAGSVGIGSVGAPVVSAIAAGSVGLGTLGTLIPSQIVTGEVGIKDVVTQVQVTNPEPVVQLREIFPVQVVPYRHGLMMVVFSPSDFSDKQDNFGSLSEYPFSQMGIAALPNSIVNHTLVLPKIEFYQGGGVRYYYNPQTNAITTQSLGPNNVPPILSATAFGNVGISSILTDIEVSGSLNAFANGAVGISNLVTDIGYPPSAGTVPSIGIGVSGIAISSGPPILVNPSVGIGVSGIAVSSGGGGGGNFIIGTAIIGTTTL